jgi:hypothetical protein
MGVATEADSRKPVSTHDALTVLVPTSSAIPATAGTTIVCARAKDTHARMRTANTWFGCRDSADRTPSVDTGFASPGPSRPVPRSFPHDKSHPARGYSLRPPSPAGQAYPRTPVTSTSNALAICTASVDKRRSLETDQASCSQRSSPIRTMLRQQAGRPLVSRQGDHGEELFLPWMTCFPWRWTGGP